MKVKKKVTSPVSSHIKLKIDGNEVFLFPTLTPMTQRPYSYHSPCVQVVLNGIFSLNSKFYLACLVCLLT